MYARVIEIIPNDKNPEVDFDELIGRFICSLKNNGQILSEYLLVNDDDKYSLYVTTPKLDSLNANFDSTYAARDRAELKKHCSFTVRSIGKNVYSEEYCSCDDWSIIEMETFAQDIDSVFICCTCGKPIALYELPHLDRQSDHGCIINWQNAYRATDELWLDGLSDKFTGKQLGNVNSRLNKLGKKIAAAMSRHTGAKIYLHISNDIPDQMQYATVDGQLTGLCPSCGKPMKYVKFCDDYEIFVCDDCSLSTDLPDDKE